MKILVTGGAGFIGSNFIRHILRTYPRYAVLNLDKLTYAGNLENLADLESNPNYQFIKGDVCVSADIESALRGVDAIVHFAAESHVDRSIADARAFVETNVQGTYNLMDSARRNRVGRFLYVSTDEVYGSLAPGDRADEGFPLAPNSPYAASKAASDLLARSFWHTYAFPVIITRASNNYGPYQFPEKLIPLMITLALEGSKLPVYGDGLNERDWIFVEDHCRALSIVLHDGRGGEIYNIGYGQPVSNLTVVRQILRILGRTDEAIEFVTDRPGHDRRYALNAAKIERELGWKPEVGLDAGLIRTVEWYRSHPDWIQEAKSGEYREYYERFYVNRGTSLAEI
ncbi:MAG: dTDP-glucose 4,6-dehydratase [Acidobacteria bacterium]|nr:dTDP-glucose 4,6-dehydratase [Acidobacteriota bacterium]